jgi:type VI protein secretion system component Hcp
LITVRPVEGALRGSCVTGEGAQDNDAAHKNLEAEAHVPAEELSDTDLEKATGGSGKVRHSDFVIVKLLDAATPKLF